MYYPPAFLEEKWAEFKALHEISDDDAVDPTAFAVWGFEELVRHRVPLYESIARNYGYTIRMEDVPSIATDADFVDLIANTIDNGQH